jgi:hypothetical protein
MFFDASGIQPRFFGGNIRLFAVEDFPTPIVD